MQQDEKAVEQFLGGLIRGYKTVRGLHDAYTWGRGVYNNIKNAGKRRGWWNSDIQQHDINGKTQDADVSNALRELIMQSGVEVSAT